MVVDGEISAAITKYVRMANKTRRLQRLPKQFRGAKRFEYRPGKARVAPGDILDWLEHNALQDEVVWCSVCKDYLPSKSLCEHCSWCDSVGDYVTPSEGSVCLDPECRDCCRIRRARHEAYWHKRRMERFHSLPSRTAVRQPEART